MIYNPVSLAILSNNIKEEIKEETPLIKEEQETKPEVETQPVKRKRKPKKEETK